MYDLSRYHEAHRKSYEIALREIREGFKQSHWMWYIFPQMKGLGRTQTAEYYGIESLEEAREYLQDPVLGAHLMEISEALLELDNDDAEDILGYPDNLKLKSCMTLFLEADPEQEVFRKVLEKFYDGERDERTVRLL